MKIIEMGHDNIPVIENINIEEKNLSWVPSVSLSKFKITYNENESAS